MGEFIRKFTQLNGQTATIILEHILFGKQSFQVQEINVFEDSAKLGLFLHGQCVFVYKSDLTSMELQEGVVEFSDKKLKIFIKY